MTSTDRRRALFLVAWAYGILALGINVLWTEPKVYPVFNWSLFSAVRNEHYTPTLMIHQIDGKKFHEPENFYLLDEYFIDARRHNIRLVKMMRHYKAVAKHDKAAANDAIAALEKQFLDEYDRVDYSIETWRYDALERFHNGQITQRIVHYTGSTAEDPS